MEDSPSSTGGVSRLSSSAAAVLWFMVVVSPILWATLMRTWFGIDWVMLVLLVFAALWNIRLHYRPTTDDGGTASISAVTAAVWMVWLYMHWTFR
jgi:hypothetical protein